MVNKTNTTISQSSNVLRGESLTFKESTQYILQVINKVSPTIIGIGLIVLMKYPPSPETISTVSLATTAIMRTVQVIGENFKTNSQNGRNIKLKINVTPPIFEYKEFHNQKMGIIKKEYKRFGRGLNIKLST